MKITKFAVATLATSLMTGSLVAQQPQATQPQAPRVQTPQAPVARAQDPQSQAPRGQAQQPQAPGGQNPLSQVQKEQDRQIQTRQGRVGGEDSQSKDQLFANSLVIANQEQVELTRFAQEKASSSEVKEFAAMLEKSHQGSVENLKQISSGQESTGSTPSPRQARAGNESDRVDFVQLQQEISKQCLEDTREYLSSKEGAEFDKCFVGLQVAKHASAKSSLTVLQRHATGKLQELVKSDLETNEKHLEAAVTLMDKLAASDSSKSDRQ